MIWQRLLDPPTAVVDGALFGQSVASSHTVVSRVDLVSSTGVTTTVYPVDGSVTVDARRAVRRTVSLRFVDYDGTLVPTVASSPLSPFDGTMRVYRGIQYGTGVREYVPLGVFYMTDVTVAVDESGVVIDVEGEDLARLALDRRWSNIRRPNLSQNLRDLLIALVGTEGFYKGVPTQIATTSMVMPSTHRVALGASTNQMPWEDILLVAQAAGFEAWFDVDGRFIAEPHPPLDLSSSESATYVAGEGSTLLGVERRLTLEGVLNRVSIKGEGSGIPRDPVTGVLPQGVAEDTNPSSPTNTTLIGPRTVEISTPIISTAARANAVASLLLPQYIGQPISFAAVPDPRLDARDIVRVTDERIGVDTTVVVDTIDMPLGPSGSMTVTGRAATL